MGGQGVIRSPSILYLLLAFGAAYADTTLEVRIPEGKRIKSAVAAATGLKMETKGQPAGNIAMFAKLLPQTAYDIIITLEDGVTWRTVDMSWYVQTGARKSEEMDDDDRKQIQELFDGIKGFENKRKMLAMRGDHDRAVVLAELIRDSAFHSDKGGEIIWRVELWYFQNQHGGWEKVPQQNKVLRRERFTSREQFEKEAQCLRWIPMNGPIRIEKDERRTIALAEPQ
jgi:hypothetical protein